MPKASRRWLPMIVLAGAILLAGSAAPAQAPAQQNASAEGAVRAFEAEVMASYNRGDAAQAARHYAGDAFVFIPGQPVTRGRDAIAANIARFMQDPNFRLGYENETIEVSAGNDLAYTRGKLMVTYTDGQTKAARTTNGHYLLVMRRDAAHGWQIVEDISF